MKIYACGGTGINIGSMFEKMRGQRGDLLSSFDISYIDTSTSNMQHISGIKDEYTYMIKDLNGSGKLRSLNYETVKEHAKSILLYHPPEKYSVVVHSGSGGSGSVIGPILVNEMLQDPDITPIVVMIGSQQSTIEASNTIKTIASYHAIAKKNNRPIAMVYYANIPGSSRQSTDTDVYSSILSLSVLTSGKNRELDHTDVYNFINYNKVTSHPVDLVALDIMAPDVNIDPLFNVISAVTLNKVGQHSSLDIVVEYKAEGYLPESHADISPIHFIIVDGFITGVVDKLDSVIENANKIKSAKVPVSKFKQNFNVEDDGMVL